MPERDELDLLIDSALRDYAEPRAGLEQRMLARVSGEAERPSPRRWIWAALVAPVVAALILLAYFVPTPPHSHPEQMAHAPAVVPTTPVAITPAAPESRNVGSPSHTPRRGKITNRALSESIARPKLDIFPTPETLSPGEQALIRFAAQAPEADRKALVAAQQRVDEPLNISAIHIPPLQSPEENH